MSAFFTATDTVLQGDFLLRSFQHQEILNTYTLYNLFYCMKSVSLACIGI